ncbi:MAG: imidazoleglycerol-phosphate dehydratase HisB [Kiritimatiellaeota bacterium]|nr:imidazoleglycerol-phosphate dehydratase HisB [Kiritimatiellota bacterium]
MRTSTLHRKTRETDIAATLNLDGAGTYDIETGIPFLNHMLELLAKHALFDLSLRAKGDLDVDDHHTAEDLGLVLGTCLDQALGGRAGIRRYGHCLLPMDDALAQVAVDLGGRPFLVYAVNHPATAIRNFDLRLVEEFLRAFATQAKMNLHARLLYGDEAHHAYESVFKGLARALRMAVEHDPRERGIPSSKGTL